MEQWDCLTVVTDNQNGLVVFGAVDHSLHNIALEPRTIHGPVGRMLRQLLGTDNPADFR